MSDSLHTIIYATVLGTVSAALLAGVAAFTKPYREANKKAEEMRSVLGVLGIAAPDGASSAELVAIVDANIKEVKGKEPKTFEYRPDGAAEVEAVAVAFAGPGLWGPVKGYLALEKDRQTIRGIVFHEHEETPGLGGEIEKAPFRDQFKGKSIGKLGIRIVRGGANGPNEVDAITGATMTCDKVQIMLDKVIRQLAEESADGQ